MILKVFEDKVIPNEIHVYFDDLAGQYLKKDYEYGIGINTEQIGRYLLNKIDIQVIEPDMDLNFLIYTKEGFEKQDYLVLYYYKYILFKELKEYIELYNNQIFNVDNINITDGKNILNKDINTLINVTVSGLFLACHIFGISKLKKLFDKEANYIDQNGITISEYIDNKNYDLTYITGTIKEKKVIPKLDETDKEKIDYGKPFVGQNTQKPLIDQIKELSKQTQELKKFIESLKKPEKKKEDINIQDILQKNTEQLMEYIKKNSSNDSCVVDSSKKIDELLEEKFKKKYGDKNYVQYFEDTTKAKVDNKDKNPLNEVMKANKKDIISQKNFDKYRNLKSINVDTITYLYDICSNSIDPLEKLESSLSLLSCRYENLGKINSIVDTTSNYFKTKIKNIVLNNLTKITNIKIPTEKMDLYIQSGLSDVDDIPINIKRINGSEYRFLMLFKNRNLVKRSYQVVNGRRIYKRARRLLDNILIALYIKINSIGNKDFDGQSDDRLNMLRNLILFIDENISGLDNELIKTMKNVNNITSGFVYIIKSKYSFRDNALRLVSNMMYDKNYSNYTKDISIQKDKSLILNLFKKEQAFKYNMKIRNCMSIYYFYQSFYTKDDKTEDVYLVCDGASINCTNCPSLSNLIVSKSDKYIEKKACANIKDKSIKPFVSCNINKVCTPVLSDWQKHNNTMINKNYALYSNSKNYCKYGGIITIVDANQKSSKVKQIDKNAEIIMYEPNDYVDVKNISDLIHNYKKMTKDAFNYYCKLILKAQYDYKKLENQNTIVAYDRARKALVNVYNLYDLLKSKVSNAINNLEVIYEPYHISDNITKYPKWMQRVFDEYRKNNTIEKLDESIKKYHKIGANLIADKKTPWCASFASYILDMELRTPRALDFLNTNLFTKLNRAKFGAIVVMKYTNNKGHVTFFLEEVDGAYMCIGGNQSGRIRISKYRKSDKILGFYWPK